MDPISLATSVALGAAGAGVSALTGGKPGLPDIPPPLQPAQKPVPKPTARKSMQDSFMTGVSGSSGPTQGQSPGGKTMLGQ